MAKEKRVNSLFGKLLNLSSKNDSQFLIVGYRSQKHILRKLKNDNNQ
tara:strand:- start:46 stop:186 length:141 start_codon:yes stop_codon:yes gene_type:complete